MNLAVNARDAMSNGGKLTIETVNTYIDSDFARMHATLDEGHYVRFSVSDTGVGMDSVVRGRVFEPFFTTKDTGNGTGFGLSTVHGIIE